jgi:hypothetical protein
MFLDGLDRLIKNGRFSSTKGTEEVKNIWIRKSDSFQAFCMDNVIENYQKFVTKKEVRSRFAKYCKLHKLKSASDKGIKACLESNYGVSESRKEVNGYDWEPIWEGITWKN